MQRHNDFWNDPTTVAAGLRPPGAAANNENNESGADNNNGVEGSNDGGGAARSSSQQTTGAANLGVGGAEQAPVTIRLNANAEAVFTEADVFARYLAATLEQVAQSLADIQPSVLRRNNERALEAASDERG